MARLFSLGCEAKPQSLVMPLTKGKWSEWRDSNSRPSGPKPDALPDCATLRADEGGQYTVRLASAISKSPNPQLGVSALFVQVGVRNV